MACSHCRFPPCIAFALAAGCLLPLATPWQPLQAWTVLNAPCTLQIAAIFEFGGAMLLGRVSTNTIAGGIADINSFTSAPEVYAYGEQLAGPSGCRCCTTAHGQPRHLHTRPSWHVR